MASNAMDTVEKQSLIAKLQQLNSDVDVEYLHSVYFPETSGPARVPCRFGMPSSVFTQSFQFYINTGANGNGFVGIAPQDTTYYPCFRNVDDIQSELGGDGRTTHSKIQFLGESSAYIPEKFSHARLVGCSIRYSYIGSREDEAGFMCGSHVYSAGPLAIDEQLIEDGFFKTCVSPGQGLRMVFLPKDDSDLEYAPQEYKLTGDKTQPIDAHDWFSTAVHADNKIMEEGQLRLQVKQLDDQTAQTYNWHDIHANQQEIAPSWYYGQHEHKKQSQFPAMMVMYFRGMKANQDSIRVDVVRHFEGLPRQELRDFVGVKRRGPSDKAVNFVKNKSMETKLHSHDLGDAKALHAVVKPVLHQVVDKPEVVYSTPSNNANWYDGLSALLPSIGTIAGDVIGAYAGGPQGAMMGGAIGSSLGSAANNYLSPANHSAQYGGGVPYTGNISKNQVQAITF